MWFTAYDFPTTATLSQVRLRNRVKRCILRNSGHFISCTFASPNCNSFQLDIVP
jgi:hypothetical protein